MNKKLKNKIAALFAVLSVCSPQSSKATDNKKLVKGLTIGIPSVLLAGGVTWGVVELVKYLKNKNNDQENKNPDGGIKFLEVKEEVEDAKKLMDDFIGQKWILDKKSECFCKCINLDDVKNFNPNAAYIDRNIIKYKNYLFDKNIEINDETIDDINNKAGYHIQKMIESYNNNKNIGMFFIKSMSAGCEILQFGVPGSIRICVEYDVKSKKPLSLELDFNKNVNENINCHWYFVHKDIANN
ncbi:MAG: hypothetical protein IJQ10_00015 [Clostridia bacterium]|nr:hypothetical protein [Clostridia bacterium]